MLKVKSLLDCTNLFWHNKYKKNDKRILTFFQKLQTKSYFMIRFHKGGDKKIMFNKYKKFENPITYKFDETIILSVERKLKKYLRQKSRLRY